MLKIILSVALVGALAGCNEDVSNYPTSNADYEELDKAVGCHSNYSDDKKTDIFDTSYKNHWMTWTGKTVLTEADEVSLNMDGKGIQDLQVTFADSKAGYDLSTGHFITVRFVMKSMGGCFLPFGGDYGVLE